MDTLAVLGILAIVIAGAATTEPFKYAWYRVRRGRKRSA
jgi:hypothetical protein